MRDGWEGGWIKGAVVEREMGNKVLGSLGAWGKEAPCASYDMGELVFISRLGK